MLRLHEAASAADLDLMRQIGLERASRTPQLMMDHGLLVELVDTWDPAQRAFVVDGIGALPLTVLDVRRILGVSDSGTRVDLMSLRQVDGSRSGAARYLAGTSRALEQHGVRVQRIMSASLNHVPLVRKLIALTILFRISASTNYYAVPCGWWPVIRACEAGTRYDWASLVYQNMVDRLGRLRAAGEGSFPYCSILMCWIFEHFPRIRPAGAVARGVDDPSMYVWTSRRRVVDRGQDRYLRTPTLSEMAAIDYVAHPYGGYQWASDVGDDSSEEEDGGQPAAAPGGAAEAAVPVAQGAPPRAASPGPAPSGGGGAGQAQGAGSVSGQGSAQEASVGAPRRGRRQQALSVERLDEDEEDLADDTIRARLAAFFPRVQDHHVWQTLTPPQEAGSAWERAGMARDVLAALDHEVGQLTAQLRAREDEVRFLRGLVQPQRSGSHRQATGSHRQTSGSQRQASGGQTQGSRRARTSPHQSSGSSAPRESQRSRRE